MKKILILLFLLLCSVFAFASVTDNYSVCDLEAVSYLGSDSKTVGLWEGNYGVNSYILAGMNVSGLRESKLISNGDSKAFDVSYGNLEYSVYSCQDGMPVSCKKGAASAYAWSNDTQDKRALLGGSSSYYARATRWDASKGEAESTNSLFVDLKVPKGKHILSVHALDYEKSCRSQIVYLLDSNGEILAESSDKLLKSGLYHSFFVSEGQYAIYVDSTGCTDAVISGIFLDEVSCFVEKVEAAKEEVALVEDEKEELVITGNVSLFSSSTIFIGVLLIAILLLGTAYVTHKKKK